MQISHVKKPRLIANVCDHRRLGHVVAERVRLGREQHVAGSGDGLHRVAEPDDRDCRLRSRRTLLRHARRQANREVKQPAGWQRRPGSGRRRRLLSAKLLTRCRERLPGWAAIVGGAGNSCGPSCDDRGDSLATSRHQFRASRASRSITLFLLSGASTAAALSSASRRMAPPSCRRSAAGGRAAPLELRHRQLGEVGELSRQLAAAIAVAVGHLRLLVEDVEQLLGEGQPRRAGRGPRWRRGRPASRAAAASAERSRHTPSSLPGSAETAGERLEARQRVLHLRHRPPPPPPPISAAALPATRARRTLPGGGGQAHLDVGEELAPAASRTRGRGTAAPTTRRALGELGLSACADAAPPLAGVDEHA